MAAPDVDIEQIRDASRRLVRELGFLRPTLAGTDLPPSAVHALVEIGACGSMTATELCEVLVLEKSSVSRMLRKLVDAGELAERTGGRDGRTKQLSLTARGRATLDRINDFAQRQVAAALEQMSPETRPRLADALASYAGALKASRTAKTGSPRSSHGG